MSSRSESADYIATIAEEACDIALAHGLAFLAYLLQMAREQALKDAGMCEGDSGSGRPH